MKMCTLKLKSELLCVTLARGDKNGEVSISNRVILRSPARIHFCCDWCSRNEDLKNEESLLDQQVYANIFRFFSLALFQPL